MENCIYEVDNTFEQSTKYIELCRGYLYRKTNDWILNSNNKLSLYYQTSEVLKNIKLYLNSLDLKDIVVNGRRKEIVTLINSLLNVSMGKDYILFVDYDNLQISLTDIANIAKRLTVVLVYHTNEQYNSICNKGLNGICKLVYVDSNYRESVDCKIHYMMNICAILNIIPIVYSNDKGYENYSKINNIPVITVNNINSLENLKINNFHLDEITLLHIQNISNGVKEELAYSLNDNLSVIRKLNGMITVISNLKSKNDELEESKKKLKLEMEDRNKLIEYLKQVNSSLENELKSLKKFYENHIQLDALQKKLINCSVEQMIDYLEENESKANLRTVCKAYNLSELGCTRELATRIVDHTIVKIV